MCARPRRVSDEEILEAAARVMSRLPPSALTLAAVGAESGLTPGALIQRFGSKRNLLLGLARGNVERPQQSVDEYVRRFRSPSAALEAYVTGFGGLADSPEAFRRNLLYLQEDLSDPDFRKLLGQQARVNRTTIAGLIKAAQEARELSASAEPQKLAALIEALIAGGLTSWAYHQQGSAVNWLQKLVRDLMKPYHLKGSRSKSSSTSAA